MYYNKVLKIWVIDQVDYFLISAIIGSLTIVRRLQKKGIPIDPELLNVVDS